jgi:hypothetical protein
MQDKVDVGIDEEEKLMMIMSCHLHLQAKINAPRWWGGSRKGRRRTKTCSGCMVM